MARTGSREEVGLGRVLRGHVLFKATLLDSPDWVPLPLQNSSCLPLGLHCILDMLLALQSSYGTRGVAICLPH